MFVKIVYLRFQFFFSFYSYFYKDYIIVIYQFKKEKRFFEKN